MKKTLYFISLAGLIIAGCAKVAPETQDQTDPANGTVKLYATMPEFVNADTKAAVSDAGVFSWGQSNCISVIYTDGSNEKPVIFECSDPDNGEFTPVDATDIPDGYSLKTAGTVAYYPTSYNGTPSNGAFTSLDEAQVSFQMHATNDNGTLKFEHDNALLKVTVNNVPSFADKLTVGGASATLSLSASGSVTAYIPAAPVASAPMTISVTEGTNTIISKTTTNSVAIEAGNFYNLPDLKVNNILAFKASANTIVQYYKDSDFNGTEVLGSSSNYKMVTIGEDTYYYTIPTKSWTQGDWYNIECAVDGDWNNKGTTWVYGVRHMYFTLSGTGSMASNYRVYWDNSIKNWDKVYMHIWGGTTGKNTTWGTDEVELTNKLTDNIYYYEFEASDYGQGYKYLFKDARGDTSNKTDDIDPSTIHEDRIFSE